MGSIQEAGAAINSSLLTKFSRSRNARRAGVIILIILWLTGWRTGWGRSRFSDQRLVHIILVIAVIILALWLLKAVLHLF